VLIYGHRGAAAVEPENTLRSFRRALDAGAGGLEFDVHATLDRIPVVIHDRNLERTTNGTGPVDRLTLAELREFDAGQGECIPTLDEALAEIGGRAHLDIEIKQGGIEPEVLDVLGRHPDARWAISSFDWTVLERLRQLSAEAELWPLAVLVSDALFHVARRVRAGGVSLLARSLTEETAPRLVTAGLDIVVWTVNDPAEAKRVQDLGAAGLCTDDPERLIASLSTPAHR
jgi:glycerophosphoryl diester phosphodiesterase